MAITKIFNSRVGQRAKHGDLIRGRCEYFGKTTDVVSNGNGTYTIAGAADAHNADIFYTMDKPEVYMFDSDLNVWWKQ